METAPSKEGPVFPDAKYQPENSLTSSSTLQVCTVSIDNTESLRNENKPPGKGLLSFPTSLEEGSFIVVSVLINSGINVRIVAAPPSFCASFLVCKPRHLSDRL